MFEQGLIKSALTNYRISYNGTNVSSTRRVEPDYTRVDLLPATAAVPTVAFAIEGLHTGAAGATPRAGFEAGETDADQMVAGVTDLAGATFLHSLFYSSTSLTLFCA